MDRKKKLKVQPLDPWSDKEKGKRSLLKVFQERLKSPGSKVSNETDEARNSAKTPDAAVILVMDSSDDDKENKFTKNHRETRISVKKVKKWKSRSERNKIRSSSKAKPSEASTKDNKERSDFKHHLKMAHQVLNVHPAPNAKVITHNRLTRRLGLFNQGKASGTIGRESLIVPEAVQKETESDIRRILGSNSTTSHNMNITSDILSTILSKDAKCKGAKSSRECTPAHGSEQKTSHSPIAMDMNEPAAMSPVKSIVTSDQDLPDSPDICEISADLLRTFNPRSLLPDRDILKETTERLQNLLRSNNPVGENVSTVTPKTVTPAAQMYPQIALRGSVSSETVSRGQGDGQSEHRELVSDSRDMVHVHDGGSGDFVRVPRPVQTISCGCGDAGVHHHEPHTHLQPQHLPFLQPAAHPQHLPFHKPAADHQHLPFHKPAADPQHLPFQKPSTDPHLGAIFPQQNFLMMNKSMAAGSPPHTMSKLEIKALTDARALLTLNDFSDISQENKENMMPSMAASTFVHHDRTDLWGSREILQHMQATGIQGHMQSPMDISFDQHRMQFPKHRQSQSKKAVVTERQPPAYMPSHTGDFYRLHHNPEAFHNLYNHQSSQPTENMDILEAIDRDSSSLGVPGGVMSMTAEPMYPGCHKKQRFLHTGSPDSDGSPMWYASLPSLPSKPQRSPSPTLKLYPRRVY